MPYYNGANLLGLALSALMKLPADDRARIKAEGLAKIARARENTARRELLAECFNNYVKLDPSEEPEFDRLCVEQAPEVRNMVNSFDVSGRLRATRDLVRKQLQKKFGELPQVTLDRLYALPVERLEEIALSYTEAATLKDLGLTDE